MHSPFLRRMHRSNLILPPPGITTATGYGSENSSPSRPVAVQSSALSGGYSITRLESVSVSLQHSPHRVQENPILLISAASSSCLICFSLFPGNPVKILVDIPAVLGM